MLPVNKGLALGSDRFKDEIETNFKRRVRSAKMGRPRNPTDSNHDQKLFEVVSRRYEEKSTLVTTNRPFAEWGEVFPNAACVVSLVDRLVHNSEIIRIDGESYRLKEAKERSEARRKQRAVRKTKPRSKTSHDD